MMASLSFVDKFRYVIFFENTHASVGLFWFCQRRFFLKKKEKRWSNRLQNPVLYCAIISSHWHSNANQLAPSITEERRSDTVAGIWYASTTNFSLENLIILVQWQCLSINSVLKNNVSMVTGNSNPIESQLKFWQTYYCWRYVLNYKTTGIGSLPLKKKKHDQPRAFWNLRLSRILWFSQPSRDLRKTPSTDAKTTSRA